MKRVQIDSSSNERFRSYLSLNSAQGIKKQDLFLISGEKLVQEALNHYALAVTTCLVTKDMTVPQLPDSATIIELSKTLFNEIDESKTQSPILVAQVPELPIWFESEPCSGVEVLLALQDPGNLGAAIRVCEAFEVSRIVLLKESAHPFHPKAIRGSSGSAWRMRISHGPSITELSYKDLITLDLQGTNINEFQWPMNFRLLLGVEGPGIPKKRTTETQQIHIPIKKGMDSLNAVSALSIALYASSI